LWVNQTGAIRDWMEAHSEFSVDPRTALKEVVTAFLVPAPTHFLTLTFSEITTSPSIARDSLRWWLHRWRANKRSSPISRLLWSAELQSRGTAHIHALSVAGQHPTSPHCPSCFRKMGTNLSWPYYHIIKESWYHHHGIARVYDYDAARGGGCAGYVTKYVLSDECCDWDLWIEGEDF